MDQSASGVIDVHSLLDDLNVLQLQCPIQQRVAKACSDDPEDVEEADN